ncbi:hypothetical protein QTP88_007788 [Uroleucon formosanum]
MIAPSNALVHVLSLAIAKLRIDVFRSDLFRMGTECVIYKQLVIHFIYGGLLCDNVRKSRMTTTIPYPLNIPLTLSQNSVRLLHRPRAPGRVIWFTRTTPRSLWTSFHLARRKVRVALVPPSLRRECARVWILLPSVILNKKSVGWPYVANCSTLVKSSKYSFSGEFSAINKFNVWDAFDLRPQVSGHRLGRTQFIDR